MGPHNRLKTTVSIFPCQDRNRDWAGMIWPIAIFDLASNPAREGGIWVSPRREPGVGRNRKRVLKGRHNSRSLAG